MATFEVPASVQQNWEKRFAAETRMHPCGEGIGAGATCSVPTRRLFPAGHRCDQHAPAQPIVDPERTLAALRAQARERQLIEQEAAA